WRRAFLVATPVNRRPRQAEMPRDASCVAITGVKLLFSVNSCLRATHVCGTPTGNDDLVESFASFVPLRKANGRIAEPRQEAAAAHALRGRGRAHRRQPVCAGRHAGLTPRGDGSR